MLLVTDGGTCGGGQIRLAIQIGEEGFDSLGVTTLQQVLWAGLRHDDQRLRYEDVERLMQSHLDVGGSTLDLLYSINEAAVASGLFGRAVGTESPPTTPS